MGDENIWVAIVSYHWPEAPQDWVQKTVVAGRWSDIETKAKIFVAGLASDAAITGVFAVSAKNIANHVLTEARDFGLAEGEVQSVPDDLTGYPDWFQDIEGKRRALFSIEAEK